MKLHVPVLFQYGVVRAGVRRVAAPRAAGGSCHLAGRSRDQAVSRQPAGLARCQGTLIIILHSSGGKPAQLVLVFTPFLYNSLVFLPGNSEHNIKCIPKDLSQYSLCKKKTRRSPLHCCGVKEGLRIY